MHKHILDPTQDFADVVPTSADPRHHEACSLALGVEPLCFNMASDFIGYTILVTLKDHPSAQIQGVVSDVIDTNLMLEDGQFSPTEVWRR